ncbi:MAG TPA: alpha/beta fold hydrolase [Rubrobacteraceae bacterium]|jgi:pimeloyl-ACP methyl ester carboxylesterase|nr:alpha/beta fold hydrolase [Rubrobacteraceae bacterium]
MLVGEIGTTVETTSVRVDGLRVRCLVAGKGAAPPVVLLHGGGFDCAGLSYRYAIEPLSRLRPVIAFDWPGYGGSDTPNLRCDLAYHARFLSRLMDSLRIRRAVLVGLSMGGGAALSFALRSRERVDKLVLAASYGLGKEIPYGRLGYCLVHAPFATDLVYALLRRSRRALRSGLRSIVWDPRVVSEELVEEARGLLDRPASGRAFRSFRKSEVGWGGLRTDLSSRLGGVAAPTLLIHGDHDRVVPLEWARSAHKRLPNSELRVLRDCGHWPLRERPDEFNRLVADFLAR